MIIIGIVPVITYTLVAVCGCIIKRFPCCIKNAKFVRQAGRQIIVLTGFYESNMMCSEL